MQIEEKELRELIKKGILSSERKKFPVDSMLSTAGFVISACFAQFYLQAWWAKLLFWLFVGASTAYFTYLLIKYLKTQYSTDEFIKDLKNSDKIRNFSLIVIKELSGTNRGKFLLRYDRRWKCFLLPYQNTHDDSDEKFILDTVTNIYQVSSPNLVAKKTDDITKYSYSDNMTKNYHHTFYCMETSSEPSSICAKKTFRINGDKFRWMSIDEMKRNKGIMKKNSETVDFIARNF